MKIAIKATGIEITQAINDYVEKRIMSLEKFLHEDKGEIMARVEIGKTTKHHKSGDVFRAEVRFLMRGKEIYAVAEESDLYGAIDIVKDEASRQIASFKDRRVSFLRRGGQRVKDFIRGIGSKRA